MASKVLEHPLVLSREAGPAHEQPERFVLDDAEVSRRHALLARLADASEGASEWQLSDQGSHNGTFVNGQRVERAQLASGDIIRVGQHLLLLQYLDLPASQRLARRRLPESPVVGDGPACKEIDEQVSACAAQDAPVLILGESGTGKELVARQLHALSGRKGALVPVNCTTLAETMADSELFGHVQGAFSGAVRAKEGLFVEAQGGSLLLDEIGDMPPAVQAKLLRAIETGEVRKVGANRTQQVDTRVLAATHVDLEAAVRAGRFRGDLLARLQRQVVRLPPLRERRDDVLLLVRHFLQQAGSRLSITSEAAEALLIHDWPFNVRELRNLIEAALQRARGARALDLEHLPAALSERVAARLAAPAALPLGRDPRDAGELRSILEQHAWSVAAVAALFGRDRKQVYRWCERFGIDLKQRK